MKAFYAELLKREGGKVNLTAAQVSEVMKHAAEIVVERNDLNVEFENYMAQKATKFFGLKIDAKIFMRSRVFGKAKGNKNKPAKTKKKK